MSGPSIVRSIIRQSGAAGITKGKCTGDPSRISPWLMLPPATKDDAAYNNFYSLASKKVLSFKREPPPPSPPPPAKVVGSSHGWVASFNTDNHHIFLSDPITGGHMKLPDMPKSFFHPNGRAFVNRLILTESPTVKSCIALMEYNKNRIGLCRPGHGGAWSTFGKGFYRDLVFSGRRKRLFAITSDKDVVEVWNMTDPTRPVKEWATDLDLRSYEQYMEEGLSKSEEETEKAAGDGDWEGCDDRYLVFAEETGQLFLLVRHYLIDCGPDGSYTNSPELRDSFLSPYPYKTFAFDAYEVDWEGQARGRRARRFMDDLNGLAMFIGVNHAVALPAAEFPEVKGDSIYFTDERGWDDFWSSVSYGGHDVGVFDYVQRSFSSVYYSSSPSLFTKINPPPFWFTPTLSTCN